MHSNIGKIRPLSMPRSFQTNLNIIAYPCFRTHLANFTWDMFETIRLEMCYHVSIACAVITFCNRWVGMHLACLQKMLQCNMAYRLQNGPMTTLLICASSLKVLVSVLIGHERLPPVIPTITAGINGFFTHARTWHCLQKNSSG